MGYPAKALACVICLAFAGGAIAQPNQPATSSRMQTAWPPVRPSQVEKFKHQLVAWLYAQQETAGHWEAGPIPGNEGDHRGGVTALVVYALLAAGESPQNPKLKPAIEYLKTAPIVSVYGVGMRINAWSYLPFSGVRDNVRADHQYLLKALIDRRGAAAGLYDYSAKYRPDRVDFSVSQYGVLGMWLSAQMGFDPGEQYWKTVEAAWLRGQNKDGGWGYSLHNDSTGSMTAAGVATLFITQDFLRANQGLNCTGNVTNEGIERGMAWLAQNFQAAANPKSVGDVGGPYYWLYGAERVGVASGRKYFGVHNWLDEGVRALAKRREPSLKGAFGGGKIESRYSTALALLFLCRGSKPVLINKLEYPGAWNQRPRDAANLSRWIGKVLEAELHWQIVGVDHDVREFHDAPVLYIAGSGKFELNAAQKANLRQYVEEGGLILAHADCGNDAFAASFKATMEDALDYKFRELPADHLIFQQQAMSKPAPLWGLSNGVRELCVLIASGDPARQWQTNPPTQEPKDASAFELARNIIYYASDKGQLRRKGDTLIPMIDPAIAAKRQIKMVRLKHDSNWDPEPGGWRRMAAILHNENSIDLQIDTEKLGEPLAGHAFAHMTGTEAITLSPEQLRELRLFLARGGTIIVDAAGGSTSFAATVEKQLAGLIVGAKIEKIQIEDALFNDTHPRPEPQADLGEFLDTTTRPSDHTLRAEYRRFAMARLGELRDLRLKGMRLGKRWAVIYSGEDLTHGLTGRDVDGIAGYTPRTATELVRRILVNTPAR